MQKKITELVEKSEEMQRVTELLAEQISDVQDNIQQSMVELTSHFMRSIEPKIKLLVKTEVSKILKDYRNK